jgi:SNF2 family DNA or RNA helicase
MNKIDHGGKILLLMDILRRCEKIGDKLLVFSQSLATLDLIEEFLANNASEVRNHLCHPKFYFLIPSCL